MKWLITFYVLTVPLTVRAVTYEERGVAAVIMGEARSEGIQGMTAVSEVIHQRSVEKGKTPLQVISSHGGKVHAFSCLNGTTVDRLIRKFSQDPEYPRALQLAQTTCEAPSRLPGITKFANHFTCATERPYWAIGHRPVAIIGRHAFYKLDQY